MPLTPFHLEVVMWSISIDYTYFSLCCIFAIGCTVFFPLHMGPMLNSRVIVFRWMQLRGNTALLSNEEESFVARVPRFIKDHPPPPQLTPSHHHPPPVIQIRSEECALSGLTCPIGCCRSPPLLFTLLWQHVCVSNVNRFCTTGWWGIGHFI